MLGSGSPRIQKSESVLVGLLSLLNAYDDHSLKVIVIHSI